LWFENQKAKNLNRKDAKSAKKIKSKGASCKTIVIPEGFYPGSRFLVSYEIVNHKKVDPPLSEFIRFDPCEIAFAFLCVLCVFAVQALMGFIYVNAVISCFYVAM